MNIFFFVPSKKVLPLSHILAGYFISDRPPRRATGGHSDDLQPYLLT